MKSKALEKDEKTMSKHLTEEMKRDMVDTYLSRPMTLSELSQKSGYCIPTIIKVLDEYSIARYSRTQLFSPNINESFFETIDTEAKAYFLGLILTDGCVYTKKGKHIVAISLKEEDRYLIEEFASIMHSNKQVTSDGRGCAGIQIHSKTMVDNLARYGIVDNKSLHTTMPQVNDRLMPHFIRGVLDGDGNVNFTKRFNGKLHKRAIRFCQGSYRFLEELAAIIHEQTGIYVPNIYEEKDTLWSISYAGNENLVSLIEYMYAESTICMKRKWNKCELILNEILTIQSQDNTEITNRCKNLLAS